MLLNGLWSFHGIIFILYSKELKIFLKINKMIDIMVRLWTLTSVLIILIIFKMKNKKCVNINMKIAQVKRNSTLLNITTQRFIEEFTLKSLLLFTIFFILWWTTITIPFFSLTIEYFSYRLSYQIHSLIIHAVVLQYSFLMMFMIQEFKLINVTLLKINH